MCKSLTSKKTKQNKTEQCLKLTLTETFGRLHTGPMAEQLHLHVCIEV